MMPSKPAVVVPIAHRSNDTRPDVLVRVLIETPSKTRRATLNRRKSDAHVLSLYPELLLLILAIVHRQQDPGPAGPAARNPRARKAGAAAVGTPVFHEFFEWVIAARLRIRTAEQGICRLIIVGP